MDQHGTLELEIEEPLSVQVEQPSATKKYTISSWFQRLFTLDNSSNEEQHHPVFIIIMSMVHVIMYLLTHLKTSWKGQRFGLTLFDLFQFFVPCMQPASHDIRIRIVSCHSSMTNVTCHYDDVLKYKCFSFMYPHQLWRLLTVNFCHLNWLHLLSNLLAQLLQGIPLERKHGSVRVIGVYWLADVGASLSFMMGSKRNRK